MNRYYNTKVIKIGFDKYYCVYCGTEAINEWEFSDRERYDYYHCYCDGAKAEKEFNLKLEELKKEYTPRMKENKEAINKLKFDNELINLKNKYNILVV